jgi:hypothetical protein
MHEVISSTPEALEPADPTIDLYGDFIGGEWLPATTGETFDSLDPHTEWKAVYVDHSGAGGPGSARPSEQGGGGR